MEGKRRNFRNKHSNPQFKRKPGPRNRKHHNSAREKISESSHTSETVYHILCQSRKIGSVIGKGGSIVKALREDTQAKITVSDSVPGSDERVITIFSPSDKPPKRRDEKRDGVVELRCAAQDALLKVHERIVEEDLTDENDENEPVVTARLLVSNNMIGCVLGRKGDVIQRLRSETGADIRVRLADVLPGCAMSDDQLVQISGKPAIAKKALFEVSTLLHQNPRKDKPLLSFPPSHASHKLRSPPLPARHMLNDPPRNSPWLERSPNFQNMQSLPLKGGYEIRSFEIRPDDFNVAPVHDSEAPSEFTIKVLCSSDKIGGVIGKGGLNVRQLEHETGASIHVDDPSPDSDERVIRISSFEVIWEQRSKTIEAVLQLQNKTSEHSADRTITTRLLVPSSKVGCIIGQGGQVINEMRRRTHADIRVLSKEGKPKYVSQDEELVQICGSFGVAKDALAEISSRLRERCLRGESSKGEPVAVTPVPEFGRAGNFYGGGLHPSHAIRPGSSGRYEQLKGGFYEYESPSFPVPPRETGYMSMNEAKMSSTPATRGSRIAEFAGIELKRHHPYSTGHDIGTPEHVYTRPSSATGPTNYPQTHSYNQSFSSQHGAYPDMNRSQVPYQNPNPQPVAYDHIYTQQSSYQNTRAHSSYRY